MAERAGGSSDESSYHPLATGWATWLWWVLASTVAWGMAGPVGVKSGSSVDIIVAGYLGVALGGIVTGVLQWLVLRRLVARAGWWVLASTVGWLVGGPVFGFMSWAVGGPLGGLISWAALGAVYGAITGPVLIWLLRLR